MFPRLEKIQEIHLTLLIDLHLSMSARVLPNCGPGSHGGTLLFLGLTPVAGETQPGFILSSISPRSDSCERRR